MQPHYLTVAFFTNAMYPIELLSSLLSAQHFAQRYNGPTSEIRSPIR